MAEAQSTSGPIVDTTQEGLLHDYALEAVPDERRRGMYQMIAVWIGWAISVSAFLVGGAVGAGTTFGEGLSAIVLGNIVLAVIGVAIGLIGYRTGLTSYLLSRLVFGRYGSAIASLVLGVLAMGFIGVLVDAFGNAMVALVPSLPWTVVVAVFALAVTVTALFGFRGLAMLSSVAAPAMLLLAVLGLWRIAASEGGFDTVFSAQPSEPISFQVAIGAVIATWITGAALAGDIARYARRAWHVVVGAFCGYVLGAGFFEAAATVTAMEVGDPNFVTVMSTLGLLVAAAVVLALALWTTTDNNLYSSALAFTNASKLLNVAIAKPVWTVVSVVIAIAVAFLGFASQFLSWLQIIATVTPPFAGILIVHFWVFGAIRRDPARLISEIPDVRWPALVAWLAASVVTHYADVFITPINGLVLGGVFYIVAELLTRAVRTPGPEPTGAKA